MRLSVSGDDDEKKKIQYFEAVENVPIVFFVFDILVKDGKDLLSLPFSERREILKKTIVQGKLCSFLLRF